MNNNTNSKSNKSTNFVAVFFILCLIAVSVTLVYLRFFKTKKHDGGGSKYYKTNKDVPNLDGFTKNLHTDNSAKNLIISNITDDHGTINDVTMDNMSNKCGNICTSNVDCVGFVYSNLGQCWLKQKGGETTSDDNYTYFEK